MKDLKEKNKKRKYGMTLREEFEEMTAQVLMVEDEDPKLYSKNVRAKIDGFLDIFKRFAGEVIGEDEKEAQNFWSGSTEAEKQIELLKQRRNDLRSKQRKTLNKLVGEK